MEGSKIFLAFVLGAACGGVGGYLVTKSYEAKRNQENNDQIIKYYEDLIADINKRYNIKEESEDDSKDNEAFKESGPGVPIDPLDRVVQPDNSFVDYSAIASEYFGDEPDNAEAEVTKPAEERKESKKEEPVETKKKSKKPRHKLPLEVITDDEFMEYSNDEEYKIRQYYLDGDIWTRLNSNGDYREDISIDDFPIPLSDFKWSKNGIAYFVNHEQKQLFKFYNEGND